MARRPVYDAQVAQSSRAVSTLIETRESRRRYRSARHFTGVWLSLETLCSSARSWLGPMCDQLELGWVDIGAHAPAGYEPLDDLMICREIMRYCITQSMRADAWGEMHMTRPYAKWVAWWHVRCAASSLRVSRSALNERIAAGEIRGAYVEDHKTVEAWAREVDGLIEAELYGRRLLVRNAVGGE